jgi:hypothetical protein
MSQEDRVPDQKLVFIAGASFRVQGSELRFDDITDKLGIDPTHTHRRGDPGRLSKQLPRDMWMLSSPLPETQELELHLNWLAERLLPRTEYISSLRRECNIDIYCFKTCYTEQASLTLSPQALGIFTQLSLELCVSLIYLPPEPPVDQSATLNT